MVNSRLRARAYDLLLKSSLPVGLQVFWKLLTASMCGMTGYAATTVHGAGTPILSAFSFVFFLVAVFTKLGDG